MSPWEPTPLTYAPTDEAEAKREPELLERTQNIFDTLQTETVAQLTKNPSKERNFLKWPVWFLGPAFLVGTGMAPTLWLPISSIFLGPNIANLMSLVGLDCIFNLGATLFLLMAHIQQLLLSPWHCFLGHRRASSNPNFLIYHSWCFLVLTSSYCLFKCLRNC